MSFKMIDFIEKKRDGGGHSPAEFESFVAGVRDGNIPDYQVASWLMAAYLQGLSTEELVSFTKFMAGSGDMVVLPPSCRSVDKHSTGGVGDKTTLIVAPLVACCGGSVAKLSGRGLGFTGGTVDKLESIPGMDVHLEPARFIEQVERLGCALSGHSLKLAPAEGKFYALRDVTGTVPSIPLIANSIVSKKAAGGASSFVFDVKCGEGAFMRTKQDAERLAQTLVLLSKEMGHRAVCIISDMEQPLGEWIGNSAEVLESVEVLSNRGPADTRELSLVLASEMLCAAGVTESASGARDMCEKALENGKALAKFAEVIESQGGEPDVCYRPLDFLPMPEKKSTLNAREGGFISRLDARTIGEAARALGGGRLRKEDDIDPSVYIRVLKKVGDRVEKGEPVFEVGFNSAAQESAATPYLNVALDVSQAAELRDLVIGRFA